MTHLNAFLSFDLWFSLIVWKETFTRLISSSSSLYFFLSSLTSDGGPFAILEVSEMETYKRINLNEYCLNNPKLMVVLENG